MTAALKPVARDLLAWLQGRPAAGEGSLKSWGQGRRPSLTLTQVEVRAAELVDTGLVTREVRPDGRSVYRARERSPEPPPVEVVTEPSPTPLPASVKKVRKAPPVAPAATPPPCAECTRLAEALLSRERLWGRDGTDLAAMEARIQEANEERDEARAEADKAAADLAAARAAGLALRRQDAASYAHAGELQERLTDALRLYESMCAELAELLGESTDIPGTFLVARVRDRLAGKATSPSPPAPSAAYGVQLALDALSTSRGTSRREVATRAGISLHSAGKALAALAAEGLAYESTPGLWRRR
jgi:hypothetical protein